MAQTRIAFALAGLGGFNAHGAGFLQAALDMDQTPDLVTATSGQIVVLSAYLRGERDLRQGLIDPAIENNPLAQLEIALFGYRGVFAPAIGAAVARMLTPPPPGAGIDFFASRLLPAQIYAPTRAAAKLAEIADTFNASPIGIVFNAYDPATGEGILYGNAAARARMNVETSIGFVPGQRSQDPRITRSQGQGAKIRPITAEAVGSALWLSLYGFDGMPGGRMDGAYHRSCIVAELHNFERVIVCRPLANGWGKAELPQSYFDVQDWNTEIWFSVAYKAEVDAMKRINALIASGAITDPRYRQVDIHEVEPETPAGYFNYFIEREAVFEAARVAAVSLFHRLAEGRVGPTPQR